MSDHIRVVAIAVASFSSSARFRFRFRRPVGSANGLSPELLACAPGGLYASRVNADINADRPALGTFAWLEQTGGVLTVRERLAMLPALLRTFGQFSSDRLRLALGVTPRHAMTSDELWPKAPDSQLCRHAETEARELQSTAMLSHGYRTWVFGAAFARIDGAGLDPELFYASALLHDVGLEHPRQGRCFTYRSAEAAEAVSERAGLDEHRKCEMMDGIATHISPGLAYEDSAIGFYLQAGAMADLAGIRAWQLPRDLRSKADDSHPREQIYKVVSRCWHAEAKAVPGGRAHLADAYGGFSRIIRWVPVSRSSASP